MQTFNGIAAAADAARNYFLLNQGAFPEHVRDKIAAHAGTGASPVDLVVTFAEAVYANQGDVPAEAREIAGGCAVLAETFGFHGLNVDARGSLIASVLDDGAPEDVPEPKADYLAPAEAPAEPPPAG